MSVKFPFDQNAYHVIFRPLGGIPEKCEKLIRQFYREKFEHVILSFEGDGGSRHSHAIVAYASTNQNLRNIVKTAMIHLEMEFGPAGLKLKKITKTCFRVVDYLHKEGDPVLIKGFQQTWIDSCLKESSKHLTKRHTVVPSNLYYETVCDYARRTQQTIDTVDDLIEVMTDMNVNGYQFANPKRAVAVLKQAIAEKDRAYTRNFWQQQFGVFDNVP